MSGISGYLIIFLIAMLVAQMITVRKQSKHTKNLSNLLTNFDDETKFYEIAEQIETDEKDNAYLQRCRIIRLYADAYYEKDDDFKEYIEKVNFVSLDVKKSDFITNEDAFFYTYIMIPHYLYSHNKIELLTTLKEKMKDINDEGTLLKAIFLENEKFYNKQDDLGQAFYEKVMEGDYGEYKYNKQLIGYYKSVISSLLCYIYEKTGNKEKYDDILPTTKEFAKTAIGDKWIKALGLNIIEEDTSDTLEETSIEENKDEEENK